MKKIFLALLLTLYASSLSADFFKNLVRSTGEEEISLYLKDLDILIEQLRDKLNKRNPKGYDKQRVTAIKYAISSTRNINYLSLKTTSVELLTKAFSKDIHVKHRNDLLIIALYKMIYTTFNREEFKMTALNYDMAQINRLYKNIQILFWRLRVAKDANGKYLFLTWQNNWQIELTKKLKRGEKLETAINDLHYIKKNKEKFTNRSNVNFAKISARILYIMEKIISKSGGEAKTLSFEVIKTIAFLPL